MQGRASGATGRLRGLFSQSGQFRRVPFELNARTAHPSRPKRRITPFATRKRSRAGTEPGASAVADHDHGRPATRRDDVVDHRVQLPGTCTRPHQLERHEALAVRVACRLAAQEGPWPPQAPLDGLWPMEVEQDAEVLRAPGDLERDARVRSSVVRCSGIWQLDSSGATAEDDVDAPPVMLGAAVAGTAGGAGDGVAGGCAASHHHGEQQCKQHRRALHRFIPAADRPQLATSARGDSVPSPR